jgi:SAM-dependent methyltransferase
MSVMPASSHVSRTREATRTQAPAAAPWYATWFDTDYYHQLYASRDDREANEFVDALVAHLRPAPGARMLDVGCGAGRHSRALAAHGFDVTGFDLSASSIRQARRHTSDSLRFFRHDMRRPFGRRIFDHVFNFFTSFGYFADEAEHACVMHNLTSTVALGGTLTIDYMNAAVAERNLVPEETRQIGPVRYWLTRWADETHLHKRIAIYDMERATHLEHEERVAKFALPDFGRMLAEHGMRIESVFGDYRLGAFDDASSPRMIVIARRR